MLRANRTRSSNEIHVHFYSSSLSLVHLLGLIENDNTELDPSRSSLLPHASVANSHLRGIFILVDDSSGRAPLRTVPTGVLSFILYRLQYLGLLEGIENEHGK